jgi:hypothetical protein
VNSVLCAPAGVLAVPLCCGCAWLQAVYACTILEPCLPAPLTAHHCSTGITARLAWFGEISTAALVLTKSMQDHALCKFLCVCVCVLHKRSVFRCVHPPPPQAGPLSQPPSPLPASPQPWQLPCTCMLSCSPASTHPPVLSTAPSRCTCMFSCSPASTRPAVLSAAPAPTSQTPCGPTSLPAPAQPWPLPCTCMFSCSPPVLSAAPAPKKCGPTSLPGALGAAVQMQPLLQHPGPPAPRGASDARVWPPRCCCCCGTAAPGRLAAQPHSWLPRRTASRQHGAT